MKYIKNSNKASRVLTTGEHTSSLMFGVQWDLVLKYLETKNVATETQLNEDSIELGNYYNSTYTLNRGKYSGDHGESWNEYTADLSGYVESLIKKADMYVLYTTGASDRNSKQNIYDLAGNVSEWTLECTPFTRSPCAMRGGSCWEDGYGYPTSCRTGNGSTDAALGLGLRVTLY